MTTLPWVGDNLPFKNPVILKISRDGMAAATILHSPNVNKIKIQLYGQLLFK